MGSPQEVSPPVAEHVVQFFDDTESLALGVAAFVDEGLRQGDAVMVVAKDATRRRVLDVLERVRGDEGGRSGRLILLDAHATLARLLRNGLPDPTLFADIVTSAVEGLGARRRVYGEMVDILAEEGNFAAVHELESLWCELGTRLPFTLLCGYASAHFAAPGANGMMRRVCHLHHRVERREHDLLANWLLETQVAN
jgi:hypothetical protein